MNTGRQAGGAAATGCTQAGQAAAAEAEPTPEQAQQLLRDELESALQALQRASAQIATLNSVIQSMAEAIAPVLFGHMRGDGQAVFVALQAFEQQHCQFLKTLRPRGDH